MGDLNGHVGTTITGYEQAIGHQGIGESNAEGKRILDFCVRNNLAVMSTYYQHGGSQMDMVWMEFNKRNI